MELVYGAGRSAAGHIEKRRNRLELSGAAARHMDENELEAFALGWNYGEARALMEERMILETMSPGYELIPHSGEAVLENDTGLLVTRLRIGNVTFWVKFTENADIYRTRVYSHRMTIETR